MKIMTQTRRMRHLLDRFATGGKKKAQAGGRIDCDGNENSGKKAELVKAQNEFENNGVNYVHLQREDRRGPRQWEVGIKMETMKVARKKQQMALTKKMIMSFCFKFSIWILEGLMPLMMNLTLKVWFSTCSIVQVKDIFLIFTITYFHAYYTFFFRTDLVLKWRAYSVPHRWTRTTI